MTKKIKTSRRSSTASVRRAISDLKKERTRISTFIDTLKTSKKMSAHDKKSIADTTEVLNSLNLILVSLESTFKLLGIIDRKTKEPLTKAEEQEIIALRTSGLYGQALYSKKELAHQYGVSIDVIEKLDFQAPL